MNLKTQLIEALRAEGITSPVRRDVIKQVRLKYNLPSPRWLLTDPTRRMKHGIYNIPELLSPSVTSPPVEMDTMMNKENELPTAMEFARSIEVLSQDIENLIPPINPHYVPYGAYRDIEKIVKGRRFLPVYISGLSGNGKTTMVEHICAKNKREYIRAAINKETDEDDLIGGFRIVNGESVWSDGAAVIAMRRGAILLLDEVNLNPDKIMCLQPVLEGKPLFLKKINQYVSPAQGFNVMATANGKGQGGEEGYDKFVGAMVMNEAFLERFAYCIEHDYPSPAIEKKIVMGYMEREDCVDESFADILVRWAETIRKTFRDGGCDDLITTRRLEHIIIMFGIFQNRLGAVTRGCGRFNEESRNSFIDLYEKIDGTTAPTPESASPSPESDTPTTAPF